MPYKYDTFDGIDLPPLNQSHQLDPNGMASGLTRSIGGSFDSWGSAEGAANPIVYRVSGSYVGQENDYLVDETGDILVDETGDALITNSAEGDLRSQVEGLRSKVRVRGTLWRLNLDDTTVRLWKTARLLGMGHTIVYSEPIAAADVTCQLETAMANWHAETLTTLNATLTNGVAIGFAVENAGETVTDAYVYITRSTGTITAFSLVCAELGIGLQWTGSYNSGTLVIDDGLQTVTIAGATVLDAYSGFSLVNHTAPGWLTLPQGMYTFTATVLGGNAALSLRFYQQFK